MSAVAHLMGGPIARMDRLQVIHPMGQPSLRVSPLYDTLNPTSPSHPMSRVIPYGADHTPRVEPIHKLGHPTEWVAPWVRPVPIESLDFPRSNHVASYGSYMTLNAYHGLQCFIMAINIATPCNPTIPITLINETLGLLYSINTQRDTALRRDLETHIQTFTDNSWTTLDPPHLVPFLSAPT